MLPTSAAFKRSIRSARPGTLKGFVAGAAVGISVTTVLAAQISFSSTGLGTGTVSVTACDGQVSVEIGHGYQTASTRFTVSSLTIAGVDAACAGKTLTLVGYSGSVSSIGISTVLPAAVSWPAGSAFTLAPGAVVPSGSVTSTAIEIRD